MLLVRKTNHQNPWKVVALTGCRINVDLVESVAVTKQCSPCQILKQKYHSEKVYAAEETLQHEKNVFLMWPDPATYLGQPCPHLTSAEIFSLIRAVNHRISGLALPFQVELIPTAIHSW